MILCHSSFKSDHKQNGFDQFGPSSECVHSFASCSCSYVNVHAPYIYLLVSHARNSKFVRFRSISPALERRFVVGIGAERRPTVFVMARWFERIVEEKKKNHTYICTSFFLHHLPFRFSPTKCPPRFCSVSKYSTRKKEPSDTYRNTRKYTRISRLNFQPYCVFKDLQKILNERYLLIQYNTFKNKLIIGAISIRNNKVVRM